MRFGHFLYPMNFDASRDYQAIDECLLEAELVEQLGLDAIWIAEHHFIGEVVYGDPLVFAAAVAARTQRVLLGLGVIEMALHNPVQLAIQTALLDNLSRGRLIVGTGRGSNYNAFEYVGFGTTVSEGTKTVTGGGRSAGQSLDHRGSRLPRRVLAGIIPISPSTTVPKTPSASGTGLLE